MHKLKYSSSVMLFVVFFVVTITQLVTTYYEYYSSAASLSNSRYLSLRQFYWQEACDRLIRYKIQGVLADYTVITPVMLEDIVADVYSRSPDFPDSPVNN